MIIIKKSLFSGKLDESVIYPPSQRLCDDILNDYGRKNSNGDVKRYYEKGFLDKEVCIDEKKYDIVPSSVDNYTIKLIVKDESGNAVFITEIIYGYLITGEQILYINKFIRLTPRRQGVGKEIAKYIRELAEGRGFTIIGAHIVAAYNTWEDAMNQEQLEAFYDKYLNGEKVRLEKMENADKVIKVYW